MDGREPRFEYDIQARARAGTSATLRACVSLYLIYLGWQLIKNSGSGESTMSPALACLFGGLLIAAALAFGVYIFRRYRSDLEAARLKPEEQEPAADGEDGP